MKRFWFDLTIPMLLVQALYASSMDANPVMIRGQKWGTSEIIGL
jgi:hypothetical protein